MVINTILFVLFFYIYILSELLKETTKCIHIFESVKAKYTWEKIKNTNKLKTVAFPEELCNRSKAQGEVEKGK